VKPLEIIARTLARLISGRQAAAATEWEALNRLIEKQHLCSSRATTPSHGSGEKSPARCGAAPWPRSSRCSHQPEQSGDAVLRQEQFIQAESFHLRALTIREKAFGPDHLDVAQSLNNLGYHTAGVRHG